MDLWIVAAATGAGYLAKYWKNQSREENSLSQLSFGDSNLVGSECSNHLLNKFARRKKRYEDVSGHGRIGGTSSDKNPLDLASAMEPASTSELDNGNVGILENYQSFNVLSVPNIPRKFWSNKNSDEHIGESSGSGRMTDDFGILPSNSSRKIGSLSGAGRKRGTSKTKSSRGNLMKPLSSFEDFLKPPSSQTFRPSSEGNETQISSESGNSSIPHFVVEENKLSTGSHFDDTETKRTVSQLPLKSLETLDAVNGWERKSTSSTSSRIVKREDFTTKGSSDESSLLHLGVFIGLTSCFLSNQRKVHKLNESLKQTESLVQDLQEELKMKEALKVKELIDDNCESHYTFSNAFSERSGDEPYPQQVMDYSMNFDVKEVYEHKGEKSSESMSRIEAELETELERLGLNVTTHSTVQFSDVDEIDPEFMEDLAEGELRDDMISGQHSPRTRTNEGASDSATYSGNYAVSPRELSLRLHDVIQWRLEARVKELEIALQNNQKKLRFIDTECKNSWLELAYDVAQSSSDEEFPTTMNFRD